MDGPNLPLEVQAAIEDAWESLELQYPRLFDNPFRVSVNVSQVSFGLGRPRPSATKLELQRYAIALFDAEAKHYIKRASSDYELRLWLIGLKSRIEDGVSKNIATRGSKEIRQCVEEERNKIVGDGLMQRIDHWAKTAESDYDALLRRGEAALAESAKTISEYKQAEERLALVEEVAQKITEARNEAKELRQVATTPKLPAAPPRESVAEQLERLRDECRLTVDELADKLDIEPRSVYRHLAGTSAPRLKQIGAYERVFAEILERKIVIKTTSGKRH